jgi:hypothetical protein
MVGLYILLFDIILSLMYRARSNTLGSQSKFCIYNVISKCNPCELDFITCSAIETVVGLSLMLIYINSLYN